MESLGGDQFWVDRFMAQHAAVFYYWVLVAMFALFPSLAYMFSELVEVTRIFTGMWNIRLTFCCAHGSYFDAQLC